MNKVIKIDSERYKGSRYKHYKCTDCNWDFYADEPKPICPMCGDFGKIPKVSDKAKKLIKKIDKAKDQTIIRARNKYWN
jgi:hypothetical protein